MSVTCVTASSVSTTCITASSVESVCVTATTIGPAEPTTPEPIKAYFRNTSAKDDDTRLTLADAVIYDPQRVLGADDLVEILPADGLANGVTLAVDLYDGATVNAVFFTWELVVIWPEGVAHRFTGGEALTEASGAVPAYYENGSCVITYPETPNASWINTNDDFPLSVTASTLYYSYYADTATSGGWSIFEDEIELQYGSLFTNFYNAAMRTFSSATDIVVQSRELPENPGYVILYTL